MSKSVETVSSEERGEPNENFVLDIFYNDSQRVGSFLSQFDDSGHLQKVMQRESASKSQKRAYSVNLSGGATLLGTGGSGGIGFQRGPSDEGSESLDREYDPLWSNALVLLDFLEAAKLIETDLSKGRVGQFVKVSGILKIHDMNTLKLAWDIPELRRLMGIDQSKNSTKKLPPEQRTAVEGLKLGIEILKTMPHGVTSRLYTTSDMIWSSLQARWMTGDASSIALRHGDQMAGVWSMVGILDAMPDLVTPTNFSPDESALLFNLDGFAHFLDVLGPIIRMMIGRPSGHFGVTPLIIYRDVAR